MTHSFPTRRSSELPRPSTGQGGRARNAGLLPEHWQGSRQGMTDDLALMTASRLVKLYRAGELSQVEATRAALDRIERYNGALNAFNLVAADSALQSATAAEVRWRLGAPRGPLDGVPGSAKAILIPQGWPT